MKFVFIRDGMPNCTITALHNGRLMRCPKVGEFLTLVDDTIEREVMDIRHSFNRYQDYVEITLSNGQYLHQGK